VYACHLVCSAINGGFDYSKSGKDNDSRVEVHEDRGEGRRQGGTRHRLGGPLTLITLNTHQR